MNDLISRWVVLADLKKSIWWAKKASVDCKREIELLESIYEGIEKMPSAVEPLESEFGTGTFSMSVYDVEEVHENCTVQVLKNSMTGERSLGWWKND